MPSMSTWPYWWEWELELSDHVEFSMSKRRMTETDLRLLLEEASGLTPSKEPGRWIALCRFEGAPWHVVVEPDLQTLRLVAITMYKVEPL
jgi:hypothetical protein